MTTAKILIFKGSPRIKGNSSTLADEAARGARTKGAQVETFDLPRMNIQPCTACDYCQNVEEYTCNIQDDMQTLYPKLVECTGLVIASPIYWFTVTAQTKLFMDRWYALQSSSGLKLRDKKVGIVLVYGDADPFASGGMNALHTFQDAFRFLHCKILGTIHGTAGDIGDVQKNPDLMEKAFHLGEKLAE